MTAVETRNLGRVYAGGVRALEGLSLSIERGEVRGLLGPNGAGKTTLVRILSTILLPSEGQAFVLGHDVVRETAAVRAAIGIVFGGDKGLYPKLTARQTLDYWAALYRVSVEEARRKVPALLDRVGLAARADDRVETYSRGMKQRLHLARGLIGDAQVLFLDEPTIGMDPIAAREFRALVGELRGEGRTILLTTHDMAEAEAVCDRVALIDHGKLLAVETPESLGRLVSQHERIDFEGDDSVARNVLALPGVAGVKPLAPTGFRVEVADPAVIRTVLGLLIERGVTAISTSRPSLEEVYVHVVGDRGLQV
ncbi:ABC transporter [Sphingobium sp. 22B]|uniref:ABC transporter ATP-binding protein n=1 Tax=unclassified Sphingobium TaxID=2611147 RepID=UPI0007847CDD|nr:MULTISPECIES: ABC transporter ATP-binding protein [unclassified Sphingobium]KXU33894.1 ABC transporter [Sphingobium sp. AM]KYC33851.1 ABC transporter [Sphingobium sp. 22B]OAP33595.1 ABC transporter [Sphingobium sp. 20006FA]